MKLRLVFTFLLFTTNLPASSHHKQKTLLDLVGESIDEATIAAPLDHEVCFSPQEHCDVKLWKFFQSATQNLDIAIFDITHPKLAHEILVASRKIKVRVVVDRREAKSTHSLVSLLVKGGAAVRYGVQRGIMHNKFTIVDGKRIETGSYNYTDGATYKNNENQIYLSESEIVERYKRRFEQIWAAATPIAGELSSK